MLTSKEVSEIQKRWTTDHLPSITNHEIGAVLETCLAETARANAAEEALAECPCAAVWTEAKAAMIRANLNVVRRLNARCKICLAARAVAKRKERKDDLGTVENRS